MRQKSCKKSIAQKYHDNTVIQSNLINQQGLTANFQEKYPCPRCRDLSQCIEENPTTWTLKCPRCGLWLKTKPRPKRSRYVDYLVNLGFSEDLASKAYDSYWGGASC